MAVTSFSALRRRNDIEFPGLGALSTVGLVVGIVLFTVFTITIAALLFWRRAQYRRRAARLKLEAEEAARESDLRLGPARELGTWRGSESGTAAGAG